MNHDTVSTDEMSQRDKVLEAISLLSDHNASESQISFLSPEGLRYLHLRFRTTVDSQKSFLMMFKRCPELRIYYPKIRHWLAEQELVWQDKVFAGNKYMVAELSDSPEAISELILSVQNDLFNLQRSKIVASDPNLSFKLAGIKAPYIGTLCGFALLICMVAFALYQLLHIPTLSKPSLNALRWEEVFAIAMILLSVYGLRLSGFTKGKHDSDASNGSVRKNPKHLIAISLLIAFLSASFFTY